MMRVYKALAKLYFALGEERELREGDAEKSVSMREYIAFCMLREYERDRHLDSSKYFLMGVSSARRSKTKPPRGKKQLQSKLSGDLPPKGKKPEKQPKSVKFLPKSKKHAALLLKAKERILAGEDFDFDNNFESGWEGDE
jgi:hypothetical protein